MAGISAVTAAARWACWKSRGEGEWLEEGDDRRGRAVSGRGRKAKPSWIRRAAGPSCWAGLCYYIRMLGRLAGWAVRSVGASSRPAAVVGGLCCCYCCLRGPKAGRAKLGWFGYSGQMPLFFFLCLLFLFYFLFLSYSMPWVDNSCIDLIKIVG